MKKKVVLSSAALIGTLATGTVSTAHAKDKIHCEGIATKWVNDCGANGHDCHASAKSNFDAKEWLYMSKKDCKTVQDALKNPVVKAYVERIQKGTVAAVKRGKKF